MHRSCFLVLAVLAPLSAQNLVPDGEFEGGGATWTRTQFNDPLGTTGFARARTRGNGPSNAVFADFQTLTPVMSATYVTIPFLLPAAPLPVSFAVMWEKQVTAPIPSPTVNRVELRIYDSTMTRVFLGTQNAPNQTGLFERAVHTNTFTPPAAGMYTAELFLRHSNLAGIPFINWVDDVVIGTPITEVFGQGCQGSGGFTPVLNSRNLPQLSSTNFAIELHDALAPGTAFFGLGVSNANWGALPLPFPLGGGCSILASLDLIFAMPVAGNGPGMGTSSIPLPIPNDPSLSRAQLFTQWLVRDQTVANPFQVATTAGLRFTIQ